MGDAATKSGDNEGGFTETSWGIVSRNRLLTARCPLTYLSKGCQVSGNRRYLDTPTDILPGLLHVALAYRELRCASYRTLLRKHGFHVSLNRQCVGETCSGRFVPVSKRLTLSSCLRWVSRSGLSGAGYAGDHLLAPATSNQ